MNTQPSAEEQVTVNVIFSQADYFFNSSVVIMENKQDPALSIILRGVGQIIPTQYLKRI